MKRYIYIEKKDLDETLKEISETQRRRNTFLNVEVKPYKGQRHPNEGELVTIVIG